MPDHIHAFVAIDHRKLDLSTWGKSFKNSISKTLRQTASLRHIGEDVFRSPASQPRVIRADMGLRSGNLVRAGLVSKWEGWLFQGEIFTLEYRPE